jgi:hypothetical protein
MIKRGGAANDAGSRHCPSTWREGEKEADFEGMRDGCIFEAAGG